MRVVVWGVETKGVLDGIHNALGNEIINGCLVTTQHSTAIGGEVKVDKRLDCQVPIVIGPSLE